MQHARIATYRVTSGSADDIIARARAGMLPIFQGQPGFVGYGLVKATDGTIISISVWQTAQEADAATQSAAQWVRDNLAGTVQIQQNYTGDVGFFTTAGPLGG